MAEWDTIWLGGVASESHQQAWVNLSALRLSDNPSEAFKESFVGAYGSCLLLLFRKGRFDGLGVTESKLAKVHDAAEAWETHFFGLDRIHQG